MEVKIDEGWNEALADQFSDDYFKVLTSFVRTEYKTKIIYPLGPMSIHI